MANKPQKGIEVAFPQELLKDADIQKFIEILSDGVCDYLTAAGKTGSGTATIKRASNALKTARDISAKCSEIPTENALISGEEGSIL